MTQTHYAYLFEAHSIQRYVMQGGKLAEMVGASELLERLTGETLKGSSSPLDDVLEQLKLKEGDDYEFSRRGGGAFFILFADKNKARKLLSLWSLIVPQVTPGLEWNHAIGEGNTHKEAIKQGQDTLRQKRNQPSMVLPEANPLIRRNPRTGLPATNIKTDQDGKVISVDKATASKLNCKKDSLLLKKFIERDETKKYWKFPRNLEHKEGEQVFPYKGDNHTIAILHADGNGLGQILMNLVEELKDSKDYAAIFYSLSRKIDKATQQAARSALWNIEEIKALSPQQGEKRVLPFRPLILGGDDLTVIIRGDLALDYARDFLLYFEEETEKELASLKEEYKELNDILPKKMTACAGIAFIRSNQPFYLGYHLAETLCTHAKNTSRATEEYINDDNIPASLAFYHVTTTMIEDYNTVQKQELSVEIDNESCLLSLGAYGVAGNKELPDFAELKELKVLFQNKEVSRGPARHLLTLMHTDTNEAVASYKRWEEVMGSRNNETLKEFKRLCNSLLAEKEKHPNLPFAKFKRTNEDSSQYRTFLADLSSWLAIEGEQ